MKKKNNCVLFNIFVVCILEKMGSATSAKKCLTSADRASFLNTVQNERRYLYKFFFNTIYQKQQYLII